MWRHAPGRTPAQLDPAATAAATPGRQTLVQRDGGGEPAAETVHGAAARGVAAPAGPLPFGHSIQRLFGRHDISGIQAHTGPAAAASARAMGASAYATGDHVVLGGGTDLHTVAHEAAHVVQQRAGVQLKGGVGAVGDPHERHADAVADRVVRGESAEDLLDDYRGSGGGAAVQRQWVDKRVVDDRYEARWEQTKGDDEERADGWYYQIEDVWLPVDESTSTSAKRKRSTKKEDSSSTKKQRERDPRIKPQKHKTLAEGLGLVEESEIGAKILQQALEVSTSLEIIITKGGTQTRLDYGGDRGGKDTIELSKDRMLVGGSGSVAQQLVMELCNLSNKMRFWETDYDAQHGTLARDAYVERNEHIEYDASVLVHQAWLAAQDTPAKEKWGKDNHKSSPLESWEAWWNHMKTHNKKHLKVYEDGFDALTKEGARKIAPPPSRKPKPEMNSSLASVLAYKDDESDKDDEQSDNEGGAPVETTGGVKLVDY
jgi:hypothetical protein